MSTFPLSLPHLEELDQTFYTFSMLHPLAWPLFGLFISPNQRQILFDVSRCIAIYEVQMKLFALVKSMHTALWRQTSRSRSEPQWFFITALSPRYFCELRKEWKQYVGQHSQSGMHCFVCFFRRYQSRRERSFPVNHFNVVVFRGQKKVAKLILTYL